MSPRATPDANAPAGPTLRRRLTTAFITVTLLSILLLGALNFLLARDLLTNAVESQLTSQGQTRAQAIESSIETIRDAVSVAASSRGVSVAMTELSAAFTSIDEEAAALDDEEQAELEDLYRQRVIDRMDAAGLDAPPLDSLLPGRNAGRYIQHRYILENPYPPEERSQLVDQSSDDTAYRATHASHHPVLTDLAASLGFGDLLLIDGNGTIVYSSRKRVDLGTEVGTGLATEGTLSQAIDQRLGRVPVGDTVLADFDLYLPAGGAPTMFAVASIRNETEVVGALAVEIPVDRVTAFMTADRRWEETGLGSTGDAYLVGADLLLRSEPRTWLEDPEAHVALLEEAGAEAETIERLRTFDTNVRVVPADTEAVETARSGEEFTGRSTDYLGRRTLAFSAPVGVVDLDWTIVAEVTASEAGQSLGLFLRRMLIVAGFLIPLVALAAAILSRALSRPLDPVVTTSRQIANGDLEATVPELGRNEIGDVGRHINTLTAGLRRYEEELAEQENEIGDLLLAALPPRVVEQVRSGREETEDLVDSTTLIALVVDGVLDDPGLDPDSAIELSARISTTMEDGAAGRNIERVRSASDHHLFAAGLGVHGHEAGTALRFVVDAVERVRDLASEMGVTVAVRGGVASGDVIAGTWSADHLSYGVLGAPAQTAMTLAATASSGQLLVHRSTVDQLETEWDLQPVDDLIDVGGRPIDALELVPAHDEVADAD